MPHIWTFLLQIGKSPLQNLDYTETPMPQVHSPTNTLALHLSDNHLLNIMFRYQYQRSVMGGFRFSRTQQFLLQQRERQVCSSYGYFQSVDPWSRSREPCQAFLLNEIESDGRLGGGVGWGGAGSCQLRVSPSQGRLVLYFQYQAGALATTKLVPPLFHHNLIPTPTLCHHT